MRQLRIGVVGIAAGIGWALGAPVGAQSQVIEERVDVIEVGVFADLPAGLRGRSAADLAARLAVLEDGVARQPVSVARLGGSGADAYGRVLIVFDLQRCSSEILSHAPAALGAQAERLVALGPVSIALLGDELAPFAGPTRSATEVATALARVAREVACGPPPAADRLERIELGAAALACPARPCLLAWAGPGWGQEPAAEGGMAPPPATASVEPLARRLASGGWALLAVPLRSAGDPAARRRAPEPEYRPESGTYTFGINVLDRGRAAAPRTAEEVSSFVDLWLAPLRRLVAATAGEFVPEATRLADALDALAGRSILYYRTERRAAGETARLEVKAPGETGRSFRTAEWAPLSAP